MQRCTVKVLPLFTIITRLMKQLAECRATRQACREAHVTAVVFVCFM